MAWDQLASLTPAQMAQIYSAVNAPVNSGEGSSSASGPRQALVGGYNWAPVTDANGNVTGYRSFLDDPNADNTPAAYNGRQYTSYDLGGNSTGTGTLSGFKNGGFGDYLPFVLAGAGLGAGALAVGAGAGAGGVAAGTAGGLDSAGGVLNSAVMGGGGGAGAVGAGTAGAAYAPGALGSGTFDAGLGNIADLGATGTVGGGAAVGAGGTAAGAGGLSTLAGLPQVTIPAASTFPSLSSLGSGGGLMDTIAKYAGPAASLASGILGSNAAKDAANIQSQSADKALALQKEMFDKTIALNEPFRAGGVQGMNSLLTAYGLQPGDNSGWAMKDYTPSDLTTDPSYQWRLQQGEDAVNRQAAARGQTGSGRYLKDLTNYAQGAASQEYGNAFNRYMQQRTSKVNQLQSLAGVGQTASGVDTNASQNYGNNASNLITGQGNANAAGAVGSANAWSNALSQGLSSYQNGQLTNALLARMGGI